jgi:hypothetical protein
MKKMMFGANMIGLIWMMIGMKKMIEDIIKEVIKCEVVVSCSLKKYCRDYCLKNCYSCRYLDAIYLKKVEE